MEIFLVLVGCIALLAALFGKRLFSRMPFPGRLLLSLLGVGFLAVAVWLALNRQTAGKAALATPSISSTSASITPSGHPPVIQDIVVHKAHTAIGLVLSAEIHFQDEDGDADMVAFALKQSSVAGVTLDPVRIDASTQEQIKGTSLTVEWDCQGTSAMVLFKTVILDKAGNRSNLVPLLLDCG